MPERLNGLTENLTIRARAIVSEMAQGGAKISPPSAAVFFNLPFKQIVRRVGPASYRSPDPTFRFLAGNVGAVLLLNNSLVYAPRTRHPKLGGE